MRRYTLDSTQKEKKRNTDKKRNKVISHGLQRLKRVLPAQQ
jgi:hypothetical protein